MSANKNKIREVNVQIRRIDNGYLVESWGYSAQGKYKDSQVHKKELVYNNKDEAVKSAMSLIDAFSKDLS